MIHRMIHNKDNPYFQMNRAALVDKRLSWKAVGLLTYLISKPDQWVIRESDLISQHTDGRDAVRSGMRELREAGYISKVLVRDAQNRFSHWEAHIYESPELSEPSEAWAPGDDEVDDVNPLMTENPATGKSGVRKIRRISDNDGLVKNDGSKPPRRNTVIPVRKMRDFGTPENEELPALTFNEQMAEILYNGLKASGKIVSNVPPNLQTWAETFRLFILRNDVRRDHVRAVVEWFSTHVATYEFMPRKIRCAESFCKRFVDISESRDGWLADQKKSAERNGHAPDEPPVDLPKIRDVGEMSAAEVNNFLGDC